MGPLFSNPGKQAQQAASGQQAIDSQMIGQLEQYTQQHEAQLRNAIAGMPLNPYNDVAFGNTGPGLTSGSNTVTAGPGAPKQFQKPPAPPPPAGSGQQRKSGV